MWGLENSAGSTATVKTVAARFARHSYGTTVSRSFDPAKGHQLVDRYRDTRGMWQAANQMSWLLRKGERIEEGRVLRLHLSDAIQVGFHVKELCTVTYGIDCTTLRKEASYRDPITKQKWRDIDFDLEIRLDSAMLNFAVFYKGNKVANTKANYNVEA
ncbi:MAG: hypothetical protein Q9213_000726 [Squamulea squamosa]